MAEATRNHAGWSAKHLVGVGAVVLGVLSVVFLLPVHEDAPSQRHMDVEFLRSVAGRNQVTGLTIKANDAGYRELGKRSWSLRISSSERQMFCGLISRLLREHIRIHGELPKPPLLQGDFDSQLSPAEIQYLRSQQPGEGVVRLLTPDEAQEFLRCAYLMVPSAIFGSGRHGDSGVVVIFHSLHDWSFPPGFYGFGLSRASLPVFFRCGLPKDHVFRGISKLQGEVLTVEAEPVGGRGVEVQYDLSLLFVLPEQTRGDSE